jgi:hypothetical protein
MRTKNTLVSCLLVVHEGLSIVYFAQMQLLNLEQTQWQRGWTWTSLVAVPSSGTPVVVSSQTAAPHWLQARIHALAGYKSWFRHSFGRKNFLLNHGTICRCGEGPETYSQRKL